MEQYVRESISSSGSGEEHSGEKASSLDGLYFSIIKAGWRFLKCIFMSMLIDIIKELVTKGLKSTFIALMSE